MNPLQEKVDFLDYMTLPFKVAADVICKLAKLIANLVVKLFNLISFGLQRKDSMPRQVFEEQVLEMSDDLADSVQNGVGSLKSTANRAKETLSDLAEGKKDRAVTRRAKKVMDNAKEGFDEAGKTIKQGFNKANGWFDRFINWIEH